MVALFKNKVPKQKHGKTLNIPSSTVHTIKDLMKLLKSLSSEERLNSADGCDGRALRNHCLKFLILFWTSLRGLRNTPQIIVCKHNLSFYPWTLVKVVLHKEEATCEHHPEVLLSSLDQTLFQMGRGKVENCSAAKAFVKPLVFCAKEEGDCSACQQFKTLPC